MDLKLKKISSHGRDNSVIILDIDAEYGFEQESFRDTVRIQYSSASEETYVTVKARNPGVGLVVARIIEILGEHRHTEASGSPVAEIVDLLVHKAGMFCEDEKIAEKYSPAPAGHDCG